MGKQQRKSQLLQSFGDRVRALRKEAGISQMELGEKAGLDHTYIGGIERGERNPTLEAIEKITAGLGIGIPEFFRFLEASNKLISTELIELVTLLEDRDAETIHRVSGLVGGMLDWVDGKK